MPNGRFKWELSMDNPFPGMDPWMEQQWGDAHHRIIVYASDQLRRVLPPDLRPRIEERVFVESPFDLEAVRYPDVRIVTHVRAARLPATSGTAVATAEPLLIEFEVEPVTQGSIQILDVGSGNKVVTVIEVLSPANKRPGEGQRTYLKKQEECKEAGVNLVEIDLLRGGRRVSVANENMIPPSYRTPYRVTGWRATRPKAVELYRVPFREKLPAVKIPLRPADNDVPLELQPLVNEAYRNGTYEDTDYGRDPVPPLEPDDAAWADALLREKGLR
jgi:Protein of unknown function (DUF4058)